MPMYVYETKEGKKGCAKCRAGFSCLKKGLIAFRRARCGD